MSKKKRERREREQQAKFFVESLGDAMDDALGFIEEATPFEISSMLAELGVSTTHRAGIEKFLNDYRPPVDDPEPLAPFEALSELWNSEIEKKRGEDSTTVRDEIYLTEIARFFWAQLHPDEFNEDFG